MKPRLLDLFCGAGGAAAGYHRAGFDVVGVDIAPQPRYPFEFHQADALTFLTEHGHEFDAIHASPPCQDHSTLAAVTGGNGTGWMLAATRAALRAARRPYVIENVVGAPIDHPLRLCGTEFGLSADWAPHGIVWLRRHRLFESDVMLMGAGGCVCYGRPTIGVYGGGPGGGKVRIKGPGYADASRAAMGIDWMNRNEIDQAIPPAYTEFIGAQLLDQLAVDLFGEAS